VTNTAVTTAYAALPVRDEPRPTRHSSNRCAPGKPLVLNLFRAEGTWHFQGIHGRARQHNRRADRPLVRLAGRRVGQNETPGVIPGGSFPSGDSYAPKTPKYPSRSFQPSVRKSPAAPAAVPKANASLIPSSDPNKSPSGIEAIASLGFSDEKSSTL
jgi:hypothetical protein